MKLLLNCPTTSIRRKLSYISFPSRSITLLSSSVSSVSITLWEGSEHSDWDSAKLE